MITHGTCLCPRGLPAPLPHPLFTMKYPLEDVRVGQTLQELHFLKFLGTIHLALVDFQHHGIPCWGVPHLQCMRVYEVNKRRGPIITGSPKYLSINKLIRKTHTHTHTHLEVSKHTHHLEVSKHTHTHTHTTYTHTHTPHAYTHTHTTHIHTPHTHTRGMTWCMHTHA